MHIELQRVAAIGATILIRSTIHHLYHKLCHHAVHTAGHKIGPIGKLLAKCKWMADAILVGCLALFGAATEHETKE
jgi:hypothetical protein